MVLHLQPHDGKYASSSCISPLIVVLEIDAFSFSTGCFNIGNINPVAGGLIISNAGIVDSYRSPGQQHYGILVGKGIAFENDLTRSS